MVDIDNRFEETLKWLEEQRLVALSEIDEVVVDARRKFRLYPLELDEILLLLVEKADAINLKFHKLAADVRMEWAKAIHVDNETRRLFATRTPQRHQQYSN